jgi:hypothetical protein
LSAQPSDNDAGKGASWEDVFRLLVKVLLEIIQRRMEELPRQQQAIQPSDEHMLILSNFRFFMEDLRREYDLMLEARKIIEQKANAVITISGVIISLLFGFTIFVNSLNNPGGLAANMLRITSMEVAVIIAAVVVIVVALILSSQSLKIGKNLISYSLSGFFVTINGQPNWAEVDRLSRMSQIENYRNAVIHYSGIIGEFNRFNLKKSSLILLSQIALLGGIILVGIALVLVYVKYLQ